MTRDEKRQLLPHRAAIYVRVSKPEQAIEGTVSIDTQLAGCHKVAVGEGFPVILPEHIFIDTHNGEELYERPELTKLREAAKKGEFSTVYVWVLDRLGRDPVHQVIIITELERTGVQVIFANEDIDDSPEGRLIRYIKGYAAQIENSVRVERSLRAKRELARRGTLIYGNRPTYGYMFNADKTALIPDPITSLIVIRLFKEAAAGIPLRRIALALENEGVPTPTGRSTHWHFTVIRKLLVKPTYWGKHTVFRTKSIKLTTEERPHYKNRTKRILSPAEDAIVLPPSVVPPLVSEELAMQVQERLQLSKLHADRNAKQHYDTLLRSGFIHCGYCGRSMFVVPPRSRKRGNSIHNEPTAYRCMGASRTNGGCKSHLIYTPIADEWVWEQIRLVILDPRIIEQEVEKIQQSEDPAASILATIDSQIAAAEKKLVGLAKTAAFVEDTDASAPLAEEMTKESQHKQRLQEERKKAQAHYLTSQEARAGLILLSGWRDKIAQRLDDLTIKERRDILNILKVTVKVYDSHHAPRMELQMELPLSGIMPITEGETGQICVVTPVGVIPIGHPAPDVPSPSLKRGRKAGGDYLHHERW